MTKLRIKTGLTIIALLETNSRTLPKGYSNRILIFQPLCGEVSVSFQERNLPTVDPPYRHCAMPHLHHRNDAASTRFSDAVADVVSRGRTVGGEATWKTSRKGGPCHRPCPDHGVTASRVERYPGYAGGRRARTAIQVCFRGLSGADVDRT